MCGDSINPLPPWRDRDFSEQACAHTRRGYPHGGPVCATRPAGTPRPFPRFYGMRIREENCNMVLLAAVTLVSTVIAGGATLVGATDTNPLRLADRTEQMLASDKRITYVSDQSPVRVVGAPFVPNTNPRER